MSSTPLPVISIPLPSLILLHKMCQFQVHSTDCSFCLLYAFPPLPLSPYPQQGHTLESKLLAEGKEYFFSLVLVNMFCDHHFLLAVPRKVNFE